jgi:hypothetical protein
MKADSSQESPKLKMFSSALAGVLLLVASTAVAFPARLSVVDPATSATAAAPVADCPANWERGSRECKQARANRTCPEQRGAKCLGKRDKSSTQQ